MFRTLIAIACLIISLTATAAETAEQMGQKLLAAMGGAQAWKDVKVVRNKAVNHHPAARLPYIQEYWYYTEAPQHVVTINNHDMNRKRAYTEAGGWSHLRGETHAFSEERLANEIQSWHRSLYRKFWLLANDAPNLELKLGEGNRLEFIDNGQFVGWIQVDENGTPLRHGGTESSENYTEFDELAEFDNIYWPKSGEDNDGWRFEILSVEAMNDLPDINLDPPK